jgi:uncharacterized protein
VLSSTIPMDAGPLSAADRFRGLGADVTVVARVDFDARMRGDGDVVSGWKNKLQSAIANVTPAGVLAGQHRRMAEPGSAEKASE